ncbi:oxidoreductase FAD/NAD(P)-binding protein [Ceratobasidium sp. AG-Ba]|nr:oxidoreductase FAD/NAD(P)-binding protein [Ceratobasidium sp. AG-Ba]QRW10948.1 oxidoreductase FAD/NAD(P)-binding protein [Ceratobasidium sp. AG-Ba]
MPDGNVLVIEGEYAIDADFQWKEGKKYDALVAQIAETNVVDTDWDTLRNVVKHKLCSNVLQYIKDAESQAPPPPATDPLFVPLTAESESPELGPLPADAPPPPSPSPPYLVSPLLQPSTEMGLVIAPFQARPNGAGIHGTGAVWDTGSGRALPAKLTLEEAKEELGRIFGYLHDFEGAPPFTVQRLAELAVSPRSHYNSAGKYVRALERTLLVTSTHKDYPLDTGTPSVSSRASTPAPLDVARSPLFTPIPFLHRAAPNSNHRSLSRSPPPPSSSPHTGPHPSGDASLSGIAATPEESIPALGLVDELDDPSPGHLSDHPQALTSVTQLPEEPLGERFVSGGVVQQGESKELDPERLKPSEEDYVRAKTPEPSPTRVLAEETREKELAAVVEGSARKEEGAEKKDGDIAAAEAEKTDGDDKMSVDEPDENKENVPS